MQLRIDDAFDWAYGASFDRHTETHVPKPGLQLFEPRFVTDEIMKLLGARALGGFRRIMLRGAGRSQYRFAKLIRPAPEAKTQKTAERVLAARHEHPRARACASWPQSRPAPKSH